MHDFYIDCIRFAANAVQNTSEPLAFQTFYEVSSNARPAIVKDLACTKSPYVPEVPGRRGSENFIPGCDSELDRVAADAGESAPYEDGFAVWRAGWGSRIIQCRKRVFWNRPQAAVERPSGITAAES